MSRKSNKSKDAYGTTVRRSEYDDSILRNNKRTGNRFRIDMTYYDRAQKVIMKDLGKESHLLQNKLENEKRTLSLGLYGSKVGVAPASKTNRKYTPASPIGTVLFNDSSFKPTYLRTGSSMVDSRFPRSKEDSSGKGSTYDMEGGISTNSPVLKSKNSRRYKTPTPTAYSSAKAETSDDFLASILSDAMNDEILYTHRSEIETPLKSETPKQPPSSRRKTKTARSRMTTQRDSIVNALVNAQECEEVIY